ncbi:mycothiol synthase [Kytococcus aerolatus]|uniref:Mycothiol acetyltransferase n=1 Tax=Kytococcus aerolatus TaxID=592308 RepID=A0A212U6E5_9MICO|nr:mycothiol synthase [Kytococcus aerolatus]SNC73661.1 mycothiol synthase [Kytococcus aerolatus]
MVPEIVSRPPSELTDEDRRALRTLVERATRADGVEPLNEESRLAARHGTPDRTHLLAPDEDGGLRGYATLANGAAEVVIDPAHRGHGIGGELLDRLRAEDPDLLLWSHGDLDGGRRLAASRGLAPRRSLWRMERPVSGEFSELPPVRLPEGVSVRPFRPGEDDETWLELNARAFADHPEQGRMTLQDLHERQQESWFDPTGFLLLVREEDDAVVAFHWTKIDEHGTGEVYVVGVDPEQQGHGLGRAATLVGLHHLAERGVGTVELYVDGDNDPAVRTYGGLGFERAAVDRQYGPPLG